MRVGSCLFICLFGHLNCLVFSELPGSVLCGLSLFFFFNETFSAITQIFFLFRLLFLLLLFPLYAYAMSLDIVPQFLGILFCFSVCLFVFHALFSSHFNLGSRGVTPVFKLTTLSLADSSLLMSPSRRPSSPSQCFCPLALPFDSFLESHTLCLHYSSVLACCLPFILEPLPF